jgi:hypothetical protein
VNEAKCYEKDGYSWDGKSCSKDKTPVQPAITFGKLIVRATSSGINIENLPRDAKVDVYNLQGELVYSTISHSHLEISIQTKGLYIVKVGSQSMRVVVK